MNMLTIRDLSVVAGEPRVADIVLGEKLGFGRARDVRHVVNRHFKELSRYGQVSRQPVAKPRSETGLPQIRANPPKGSKGGRPSHAFMLNEGQALLVCMFANTERAADVRQQLIEVFMAWRSGKLAEAPRPARAKRLAPPVAETDPRHKDFRDPLLPIDGRRALIERLHAFDGKRADDQMMRTITHLLTPSGASGRITWPRWYHDKEVLTAVVQTHRQASMDRVLELLKANFGWRAPSRSSLHRFWLRLDGLFGTGRKLH